MVHEDGSSSVTFLSPPQIFSSMSLSPYRLLQGMKSEERGLCLIHLLIACTNHVASGCIENANIALDYISHLASPDGDTMQRIAAYFTEALANCMLKSWPGLHKALNSTKIDTSAEEFLALKLFFEFCPFYKLSYVITNQAILEAMKGEKVVHIIDLHLFEPSPWISFLQALRARPEGPPHLRITGVHEQKEVLDQIARRLNEEAEKLDVPFQFNPVVSKLENVEIEHFPIKMGEAVAIASVLKLHTLFADNSSPNPWVLSDHLGKDFSSTGTSLDSVLLSAKMLNFLNGLWGLSPKIMVLAEQESNHNGVNLINRVLEALNFYAALFDCLESVAPRASIERMKIEKMLFGEEIKNIVACDGMERKKRHERAEKWGPMMEQAGFGRVTFSYVAKMQATRLLHHWNCDGYGIREENGWLMICWHDQPLFVVSAWGLRR